MHLVFSWLHPAPDICHRWTSASAFTLSSRSHSSNLWRRASHTNPHPLVICHVVLMHYTEISCLSETLPVMPELRFLPSFDRFWIRDAGLEFADSCSSKNKSLICEIQCVTSNQAKVKVKVTTAASEALQWLQPLVLRSEQHIFGILTPISAIRTCQWQK